MKRIDKARLNIKQLRIFLFVIAAISLCGSIFSVTMFSRASGDLRRAIQLERIDYVSEISRQLMSSREFMESEYESAVISYASILNSNQVNDIQGARALLSGRAAHTVMLASTSGGIMDLNGRAIYLPTRQLLYDLGTQTGVIRMFTSLGNAGDCWVFATRMQPVNIGSMRYDAVMLAIPADEFRDMLAVAMFDNRGASYIIRSDGSIDMKPQNVNNVFTGYNLFASMLNMGAPAARVDQLKAAVGAHENGSMLIKIHNEQWLISYDSISDYNAIIVAVPLAITAADTYAGLNDNITFASMTVITASLFCLTLIVYFLYRDRERKSVILAAEAKSDFFSKMSHDIRTPLNAIIGLETLARDSDSIAEIKGYLAQSASASNYLLSIINDVLDMSRINSGKISMSKTPFDINNLITDTASLVESMASEKGIRFTREGVFKTDTCYLGDAVRLRQVLVNLLSNSVKYTDPGGSIWLTARRRAISGARDEFTFFVRDSGIGMSKQFMSRLFTPFEQEHSSFTTQYTGSGLGLAIVKNLIKLMDGEIEVKSQQGKGTVFTVKIPLTRSSEADVPTDTDTSDNPKFTGKRVLIAEDNVINMKIAVMLLKTKFDIEAESASDGAQALKLFELSEVGYYDLILMDVKMPNMDGLEATRRIRALNREDAQIIPIIALSANAFAEDVALSLTAGMNTHLSKPLDVAALNAALRKYLG